MSCCAHCDAPLVQREGERSSKFARRQTCGRRCSTRLPKSGRRYEPRDCGFTSPCWVWLKHIAPTGYGMLGVDGRSVYAHRWAYERWREPIPEGMVIDHLCRNRACVNPDHLEVVTNRENIRRGCRVKLTPAAVLEIRVSPLGNCRLARMYGVTRATISAARRGQSWSDVPFPVVSEPAPVIVGPRQAQEPLLVEPVRSALFDDRDAA